MTIVASHFTHQLLITLRALLLVRYRQSFFGFLWVFFSPLLTFGVQAYAFHEVLNLNVDRFHLFLLSGLLPWLFMSQSIDMCISSLIQHAQASKDHQVSPLVFLGAQVLDNFINFLAVFSLLLLIVTWTDHLSFISLALVVPSLLVLLVGVSSLGFFFAALHVLYRDVKHVVAFGLTLAYFLTPIFYPESSVPEKWRWAISINPLYKLIRPVRSALMETPSIWAADFAKALVVTAVLAAVSIFYWKKRKNEIRLYL